MPIITIIVVLVIAGLLLYAINKWIPMQSTVKSILNLVVIIILIVWLLKVFGVWGAMSSVKV